MLQRGVRGFGFTAAVWRTLECVVATWNISNSFRKSFKFIDISAIRQLSSKKRLTKFRFCSYFCPPKFLWILKYQGTRQVIPLYRWYDGHCDWSSVTEVRPHIKLNTTIGSTKNLQVLVLKDSFVAACIYRYSSVFLDSFSWLLCWGQPGKGFIAYIFVEIEGRFHSIPCGVDTGHAYGASKIQP